MHFQDYCARKKNEYGEKFDDSALSKQFIFYFNAGEKIRVKVQFPSGEVIWGFVGIPSLIFMEKDSKDMGTRDFYLACVIVQQDKASNWIEKLFIQLCKAQENYNRINL